MPVATGISLVQRDDEQVSREDELDGSVPAAAGGLYDGFEAYRTPTAEHYRRLLTSGLVVPAAGDYLVWTQVLREARQRQCDVLLVTGDVKEDWWRRTPHGEL